jgi:gamma-glutamylcyclotransferase (GGCT)/AIG2-like uncharacterized protein YtfP
VNAMNEVHLLFGYGTMQHDPNMKSFDRQLSFLGAKYVGDGIAHGRTIARITYSSYEWAGLIVGEPADFALGEVFEVTPAILASLDQREQCFPRNKKRSVYWREQIEVVVNGLLCHPWAYTVDHNPLTDRTVRTPMWPTSRERKWWGTIRTHELPKVEP